MIVICYPGSEVGEAQGCIQHIVSPAAHWKGPSSPEQTREVIVHLAMTIVGALLLIIVGTFAYHLNFLGHPLSMLAAFVLSFLSIFTIGFVIASLAPSARTAEIVGFVLYFPMLFLSGATFPIQLFPPALRQMVQFVPTTHVVNLLQGLWLGESWGDHLTQVVVLVAITVGGVIVSSRFFRWRA